MSQKINELEESLGHTFNDSALLDLALTHRSFGAPNNERLEFLGDALLDLIISEALFQRFPRASEGQMTRARSALVKGETLAAVARHISLGSHLHLGSGELKSGGYRRASILADAVEAILGAIYLDAGVEHCRKVVLRLFDSRLTEDILDVEEKDPKTRLQEWMQARKKNLPVYSVVSEEGGAQDKLFKVRCSVAGLCEPQVASSDSKRGAEMAAAESILKLIQKR